MRQYLSGDSKAFEELYRLYAGRVRAYLLKRLPTSEDADELLQLAFLKFHHARHRYDFEHPVLQWLYVICRNSVIDFHRQRGTQQMLITTVPEVDSSPEEVRQIPWEHVTIEQKQTLEWRFLDELSYEEIATKLDRSTVSVRKTISRAIKKLRTNDQRKGSIS